MKSVNLFLLSLLTAVPMIRPAAAAETRPEGGHVIVAYVTSWSDILPDPHCMTHINYAFGHVSERFDGVRIDNEERLRRIVALKRENPDLKVLLSVGGWGSGGFSEMAGDRKLRAAFARDCLRKVEEFGLDGVDIDWEYPTSDAAGISASAGDTRNFTLLMKELRRVLGRDRLLTMASVCSASYVDFAAVLPALDFIHVMAYDMDVAPRHHAALGRSELSGRMTVAEAVAAHLAAGVPASKIVLGMPFYGRGRAPFGDFCNYGEISLPDGCRECWDDAAQAPYLADADGTPVLGFDNPRSLALKCAYIREQGLAGGMYWDYAGDNAAGDLRRTLFRELAPGRTSKEPAEEPAKEQAGKPAGEPVEEPSGEPYRVLVLTERGGQHGAFTDAALRWLSEVSAEEGFETVEINSPEPIDEAFLSGFRLIIQLDYPPYNWSDAAKAAFERYLDRGLGGWIGFHHAALLGDFDGFPMWGWFSDFLGGIRFENYIAATASATVRNELPRHPVMEGVRSDFTVAGDEWYTFDRSPRHDGIRVLASVDESTYEPASEVKMGDHPVVWTSERKRARNVYFLMGHSASLFENADFVRMFRNAIRWTAGGRSWFPRFRALAFHNPQVEPAHREFAEQAIRFFREMTVGDGFVFDVTETLDDMNDEKLRSYDLVISLNDNPGHTPEQRAAFERYMERGGGWMGFHAAAYNDASTGWPWFVDFLGGAVFRRNNWPPMPAKIGIDDPAHFVAKAMPATFLSPVNEWYQWEPSPRLRPNVKVLATLSEENYPLGLKDILPDGDLPVVWTNTDYRMIYLNMGHGTRIFNDPTQNNLIFNALRWVVSQSPDGDPFE